MSEVASLCRALARQRSSLVEMIIAAAQLRKRCVTMALR